MRSQATHTWTHSHSHTHTHTHTHPCESGCHACLGSSCSSGWNGLPIAAALTWGSPHISNTMNLILEDSLWLWTAMNTFLCRSSSFWYRPSNLTFPLLTYSKSIRTNIPFVLSLDEQWFISLSARWESWLESIMSNSCHSLKMLPTKLWLQSFINRYSLDLLGSEVAAQWKVLIFVCGFASLFFFQDTGSIQLIYGIINVVMVLSIFLITIVTSPVTQELLRTEFFSSQIHGVLLSFLLLLTCHVLPVVILHIWSVTLCIYIIYHTLECHYLNLLSTFYCSVILIYQFLAAWTINPHTKHVNS